MLAFGFKAAGIAGALNTSAKCRALRIRLRRSVEPLLLRLTAFLSLFFFATAAGFVARLFVALLFEAEFDFAFLA